MINIAALSLSIGLGQYLGNYPVDYYDHTQGIVRASQPITENISANFTHMSDITNGLNTDTQDVNLISIEYKIEIK